MHTFAVPVSTRVTFEEQLDSFSTVRFLLHSALSSQVRKQKFVVPCVTQMDPSTQSAFFVQPEEPQ